MRSAPKLAPSTTLAGEASGTGAELLPAGQQRRFAIEEEKRMRDQTLNCIEVANETLVGRVVLPDGGIIEIVGKRWPEYGEGAYRLYDATSQVQAEIGACWQWSSGRGGSRRSMLLHKDDVRQYGHLRHVKRDQGTECYLFEPFGDLD